MIYMVITMLDGNQHQQTTFAAWDGCFPKYILKFKTWRMKRRHMHARWCISVNREDKPVIKTAELDKYYAWKTSLWWPSWSCSPPATCKHRYNSTKNQDSLSICTTHRHRKQHGSGNAQATNQPGLTYLFLQNINNMWTVASSEWYFCQI
jgi:hypothetical protein